MLNLDNDMIKLYENKILYIVNKYANNYNKEDLLSAGKMGLIKASKNYDENSNASFSTFCELYIKGEILDYIRKDKNIKVSRDFYRLKRKIDIATNHYFESKKRYPNIEELSYIVGESKEKILTVLNTNQNIKSLDDVIKSDNEDLCIKDTVSRKDNVDIIDLISLKDALNTLSEEEKNIIKERYYNGKTQSELAKELNTTQVKVYRMERKILDELNYKMAS